MIDRRQFLGGATAASAAAASAAAGLGSWPGRLELPEIPVRTITKGPEYHWFGYYDKLQFDPENRLVLGMEVGFHHRSPKPEDVIRIGMVDLEDSDKWIELGESRAWCWQQGCMLQWRPGSKSEVLWNDREDDHFVCRVMDVKTKKIRTLPRPIYTVTPDGKTAIGLDFARLQHLRPGYGYAGVKDRTASERIPKDSGIYRVDLETGEHETILSLAELVERTDPKKQLRDAKHYFNHLLFSSDGSRFIFLHRWRPKKTRFGFITRMLTATPEGKDVYLLDPSGHTSHFIWRDPRHILAWSRHKSHGDAFYLFKDKSAEIEVVGAKEMPKNGHCTYLPKGPRGGPRDGPRGGLPGGEWILNDTYPQGAKREQTVYLFNVKSKKVVVLGRFHSPKEFRGEWRCDTHPRASRDGKKVVIDSPHVSGGRQLHLIDL